jgi:DNA recombination protein RmuC
MDTLLPALGLLLGSAAGASIVWLLLRTRVAQTRQQAEAAAGIERAALLERLQARERQIEELRGAAQTAEGRSAALQAENTALTVKLAALDAALGEERRTGQARLALLNEAREQLSDAFKALSADALKSNNQTFLELAKMTLEKFQEGARGDLDGRQKAIGELVKPLKESLEKVDAKVAELEKTRAGAYASLEAYLKSLTTEQQDLRTQTANLVQALRTSEVRGRWGEMQLKRAVEMAGMVEHCDFEQQQSADTEAGRLRPDLIVRLPNMRNVVVDAKTPLQAYLEAVQLTNETQKVAKLCEHAKQVRRHVQELGAKEYWNHLKPTPDFVLLFLPGEAIYRAALEHDPSLIEVGARERVLIASPTILISLLWTVAHVWREERIARNAQEISELGNALHERLRVLAGHFGDVGSGLGRAIESYNKAVGSFETRVLVAARKFKELGAATGAEIDVLKAVDAAPRTLSALDQEA